VHVAVVIPEGTLKLIPILHVETSRNGSAKQHLGAATRAGSSVETVVYVDVLRNQFTGNGWFLGLGDLGGKKL
jgi:hypothetical protein